MSKAEVSRQKSEVRPSAGGVGRELVNWLLPVYVVLITAGYFVFRSGATMVKGNELTGDRALFSAVNAATLTGLAVSVGPDQFLWPGKVAVFAITALGAIFSMVIGGTAVVRIVGLGYSDWRVVRWAVGTCGVATLLGLLLLSAGEMTGFEGAFMGLSAFANSGLHFGPLPGAMTWQTQLVIGPLIVLGGIGLPAVMELADWGMGRRRQLSFYTRVVLGMTAGIYLVATALCVGTLISAGAGADWRAALATASATAIDARTGGMGYVHGTTIPRAMQWILMAVMVVGAAPGGTGGGLKVTTVAELWRGARRALRGERVGRGFGIAMVWAAAYVLGIGVLLALLVTVAPQVPADRMLFDLVSAVGNVGLSSDVLSIVGAPLYILSAAMFAGRFASLLVLWWVADTAEDAELPVG